MLVLLAKKPQNKVQMFCLQTRSKNNGTKTSRPKRPGKCREVRDQKSGHELDSVRRYEDWRWPSKIETHWQNQAIPGYLVARQKPCPDSIHPGHKNRHDGRMRADQSIQPYP